MAFPVIGGTQESGYNIDNSLRFNDDDSAYVSKAFSVDPTSRQTFTFSGHQENRRRRGHYAPYTRRR